MLAEPDVKTTAEAVAAAIRPQQAGAGQRGARPSGPYVGPHRLKAPLRDSAVRFDARRLGVWWRGWRGVLPVEGSREHVCAQC